MDLLIVAPAMLKGVDTGFDDRELNFLDISLPKFISSARTEAVCAAASSISGYIGIVRITRLAVSDTLRFPPCYGSYL